MVNLSKRYSQHPSLEALQKTAPFKIKSLDQVKPTPWVYWTSWFLGVFFIILAGLLALVPWQQTSFGFGSVVPYLPSERLQKLQAPVKGLIARWHVVEGDIVAAGDPVVELEDIDPQLIDRLKRQQAAAEMAVSAAEVAVTTSKLNLSRQSSLAQKGLKSQRDFELAQLEYQKFLAELASKQKEMTDVEVKLARQQSQIIVASRAGVIMRIYYPQGGTIVKEGSTLATLAPKTDQKVVELFVDGNDLPLISEGRKVRLQFEGWPAIQFSGWPSVAVGTFGGKIINIDPSDNGKGQFRILVSPDSGTAPWPQGNYLRQGVRVKGWVILESVSLGFELWRKFNGFPPMLTKSKKETSVVDTVTKGVGKLAK